MLADLETLGYGKEHLETIERVTAAPSKAKLFAMLTGKALVLPPVNHGVEMSPNTPITDEDLPF